MTNRLLLLGCTFALAASVASAGPADDVLRTVDDRLAREFISHDGLLLDYVGEIPTAEEIADLKPNAMGWWCPIENGSMFTGEWLPALMSEGPSRKALVEQCVRGLIKMSEVSDVPGFIARGTGTDGRSHHPCGSNDQTDPWFHGLCEYCRWPHADPALKAKALERLVSVARALEANGWGVPCDGVFKGQNRGNLNAKAMPFWGKTRLLYSLKSLHQLTGDRHWGDVSAALKATAIDDIEAGGEVDAKKFKACYGNCVWIYLSSAQALARLIEMEENPQDRARMQKGLSHYAARVAPLMKNRVKYENTTERPFKYANWRTGYAWRVQKTQKEAEKVAYSGKREILGTRKDYERNGMANPLCAAAVCALSGEAKYRDEILATLRHYDYSTPNISEFFHAAIAAAALDPRLDDDKPSVRRLSTGVAIPDEGVPMWHGGSQYTTRMETRPVAITNEAQYLKWKWRTNLADPKTGLDNDGLIAGVKKIAAESGWREGKEDWYDVSVRMFDFLVDNVQIGFSKYDCFPAISAWDRHARPSGSILRSHAADVDRKYVPNLAAEIGRIRKEGRATVGKDFDHSAPDWDDIFRIGFPGMKARVDAIDKDSPFYRAEKRTAAAMMRFLDRLIATAKAHPDADAPLMKLEIESLERLRKGPPQTCFDLMEFTMVYFILSEPLNYFQVRTMGNIDRLWLPYYERDLKAGRTTEVEFREQFRHFIWQFGSIDNYWGHPIYLGGVNLDGRSAYNELSPIILDVVDKEALPTPKFQLKIGPDTPDAIWNQALDMLRRHRSLVLMSEPNMMESMKAVGLPEADAKDLLIWGCFEYLPRARGNCTSASRINMPQPVVEMLRACAQQGAGERCRCRRELSSFADFKREYLRILTNNAARVARVLRRTEPHLAECNPSLVLSLAVPSALERGVDAFSLGYDYNYTTISMNGLGTAIDSLLAVKEFVYERKEVSLEELGRAIAADWKGYEALQLKAKHSTFKWGCGNPEADALAKEVAETFTGSFVGTPNGRGGKFVCYGLTSRGFVEGAKQLASATPDGRNKADHFSKNIAPSVGSETEGVSGSIRSMNALGPRNFPCGAIYDVMIHPSMVSGEKGLFAFRKIVERYFAGGGIAMNINIVSPELLRDAQKHPEKYENLQVRVAGWNIRWNDIPKKEQDEYIRRAESVAQ